MSHLKLCILFTVNDESGTKNVTPRGKPFPMIPPTSPGRSVIAPTIARAKSVDTKATLKKTGRRRRAESDADYDPTLERKAKKTKTDENERPKKTRKKKQTKAG
jgi:hypothetical protein